MQTVEHLEVVSSVALHEGFGRSRHVPKGEKLDEITLRRRVGQAAAFREALARRGELDREGGIDNLVLTAWNGGIGTEAQTVMIRVSAENIEADRAGLAERMRIREGYWDAWAAQNQIMTDATRHIETHDQTRVNELSYPVRNQPEPSSPTPARETGGPPSTTAGLSASDKVE